MNFASPTLNSYISAIYINQDYSTFHKPIQHEVAWSVSMSGDLWLFLSLLFGRLISVSLLGVKRPLCILLRLLSAQSIAESTDSLCQVERLIVILRYVISFLIVCIAWLVSNFSFVSGVLME